MWCECLLAIDSISDGLTPADFGVPGREVGLLGLASGKGKDAELRRASMAMFSRCDGLLEGPKGDVGVEPEDDAGLEPIVGRDDLRGVSGRLWCASGVLDTRLLSLGRLDLVVPAVTVWARVGFTFCAIAVSATGSVPN